MIQAAKNLGRGLATKLLNIIFNKKFFFTCLIVFITSISSRYLILIYFDVNVFTDIFNKISISYYAGMSVHIRLVGEIINELLKPSETMMASNIPPAGGNPPMGGAGGANVPVGGANNTGINGNLRAGRINGYIEVPNPDGSLYIYSTNYSSQPLMGSIANVMQRQADQGVVKLSGEFFSNAQSDYIVAFLKDKHPHVYARIAPTGFENVPKIRWANQGNTQTFRNLLRNAP